MREGMIMSKSEKEVALLRVKRATKAKAEAEALFLASISRAASAGLSYREIAEEAGVSKPRIGQLVAYARAQEEAA